MSFDADLGGVRDLALRVYMTMSSQHSLCLKFLTGSESDQELQRLQ
jgi:hypothetical protein